MLPQDCVIYENPVDYKSLCGKEIMVSLDRGRFTMGRAQTSWQKCKATNWAQTIRQWVVARSPTNYYATRAINKHEAFGAAKHSRLIRTSECLFEVGHGIPASCYFAAAADWAGYTDNISQICIAGPCCHNDGQCTIENSIGQPHSQLDWRLYFVSRCAVEQWAWLQGEDWQWHSHSAVISCQ